MQMQMQLLEVSLAGQLKFGLALAKLDYLCSALEIKKIVEDHFRLSNLHGQKTSYLALKEMDCSSVDLAFGRL